MKDFIRYTVLPFLLTLVLCLAVVNVAEIKEWQTLIAGLLALSGAALVLVSANKQIENERQLARENTGIAERAAKIRLAAEFENLAREYSEIAVDLSPLNSGRLTLPIPFFAVDTTVLTSLSGAESQGMLLFAHDVAKANEPSLNRLLDPEPTRTFKARAARLAVEAIEWRNRFGDEVGWTELEFSDYFRAELAKRAAQIPDA